MRQLKSGKKRMDEVMRGHERAAAQAHQAYHHLSEVKSVKDGVSTCGSGAIEINGKSTELRVNIAKAGQLTVSGLVPIKMTDFGIRPLPKLPTGSQTDQ